MFVECRNPRRPRPWLLPTAARWVLCPTGLHCIVSASLFPASPDGHGWSGSILNLFLPLSCACAPAGKGGCVCIPVLAASSLLEPCVCAVRSSCACRCPVPPSMLTIVFYTAWHVPHPARTIAFICAEEEMWVSGDSPCCCNQCFDAPLTHVRLLLALLCAAGWVEGAGEGCLHASDAMVCNYRTTCLPRVLCRCLHPCACT